MSLATSCPSCGTVFKVVEDQLKVSEGWVRCGHCHDVFNALEGLFDLERRDSMMQGLRTLPGGLDSADPSAGPDRPVLAGVAPAPGPTAAPALASSPPTPTPTPSPVGPSAERHATTPPLAPGKPAVPAPPTLPTTAREEPPEAAPPSAAVAAAESAAPPAATSRSASMVTARQVDAEAGAGNQGDTRLTDTLSPQPAPASVEPVETISSSALASTGTPAKEPALATQVAEEKASALTDDEQPPDLTPFSTPSTTAATEEALIASTLAASHQADDLPAFVRDAERRARWDRPLVRTVMSLAVIAGAALLTAQVAMHHRDRIAAQCEDCKAPLATLSSWLGFSIRPPVMLDAVEVDNAVLTHPPGADGYRLTVQVRNHSSHEVLAPHMELSLTDASGALLIRRVFSPQDFQQPTTLSGQAENSWNLEFQTLQKRVSGYTVAAFYP